MQSRVTLSTYFDRVVVPFFCIGSHSYVRIGPRAHVQSPVVACIIKGSFMEESPTYRWLYSHKPKDYCAQWAPALRDH